MNRSLPAALCFALALGACANTLGNNAPPGTLQGKIEQITNVQLDDPRALGVAAVVGGVYGAAPAGLTGAGSGKDVAIAMTALAGAAGGPYAQDWYPEDRYPGTQPGQQIAVRLDAGVLVIVTQAPDYRLDLGQRAAVEGSGPGAHVVSK